MNKQGVAALALFLETWARHAVAGRHESKDQEDAAFKDALAQIEKDFQAFLVEARR